MISTTVFDSQCSKPMELDAYGTLTVPEPEGVCVYKQVFALFSFAAFVIIGSITCMVREKVRAKYAIPPTCCGSLDDFCCGFFCPCLNQTQILRHLEVFEEGQYSITSPVGVEAV